MIEGPTSASYVREGRLTAAAPDGGRIIIGDEQILNCAAAAGEPQCVSRTSAVRCSKTFNNRFVRTNRIIRGSLQRAT